jgi:CO/xanthine dehydrogenase FAD-binding subunit
MILEYHRPKQLEDAIALLSRKIPATLPLGGGTWLSQATDGQFAVVDLQSLGLDQIERQGNSILIGATVTLEQLIQHPEIPDPFKQALRLEATLNLRNASTAAGRMVVGDASSPYLCMLLASDAKLTWQPGNAVETVGDYLTLRHTSKTGRLITHIELPVQVNAQFASVGRAPMDRALVCAAVARWPSGRTRIVIGGDAPAPILVMDGTEVNGFDMAIINACSQLRTTWTSKEYIINTTTRLVQRMTND